ncbi:UPF0547 [Diplonema papillatum]|nr:UPF0547 [Diplonema papillatum]
MTVCYLCGEQFGSALLGLHQAECYEKRLQRWKGEQHGVRGPKPIDPFGESNEQNREEPWDIIPKRASVQFQEFNDNNAQGFGRSLKNCPRCNASFLPYQLTVHMRSCRRQAHSASEEVPVQKKSEAPSPPNKVSQPRRPSGAKVQLLACNLCGHQFGTNSLLVHAPQCYENKLAQWKAADPSARGSRPRKPSETIPVPDGLSSSDLNSQQDEFVSNQSRCEGCGCTFLPENLHGHQRVCTGAPGGGVWKPGSKSRVSQSSLRSSRGSGPSLPTCSVCGEMFGTSSIAFHEGPCYFKHLRRWEREDPSTRGPMPVAPPEMDQSVSRSSRSSVQSVSCDESGPPHDNINQACKPRSRRGSSKDGSLQAHSPTPPSDPFGDDGFHRLTSPTASPGKRSPLRNRLSNPQNVGGRTCSHCNTTEYDGGAKFCQECGARLPVEEEQNSDVVFDRRSSQTPIVCCNCDHKLSTSARFCDSCGHAVPPSTESHHPIGSSSVGVGL